MRFSVWDRKDHWPFEGMNYFVGFYFDDLTVGLEVTMMDWLEKNSISHAWSIENRIAFKRENDRLMFILRFQ